MSSDLSREPNFIGSSKAAWREEAKKFRKELDNYSCNQRSKKIVEQLFDYLNNKGDKGKSILAYTPNKNRREVDVEVLLSDLASSYLIERVADTLKADFPKSTFDYILVPSLVNDRNGFRVGYGSGWYDRFLSVQPKTTLRIGVQYHEMLVPTLPIEVHDQRLDVIITESEVIILNHR
jgi:5-formyltetrahydrofolate cyclo-ligase